jgi:hypothetical protein
MSTPSDGYKVGYGHPPRETRWKKGQSGNPRRKKTKRPESTIATIDGLLLSPIKITLNGEAQRVSTLEAIVFQLFQKAIAGSGRAFRTLLKYQEFASQNLEKKLELTFVDDDYTRAIARLPSKSDHDRR